MNEPSAVDRLADEDLVRGAAAGDRDAFAALYRRRRPDVFRFALHMTAETSVAEDVVQEVFMVVMDDAARFEPGRATVAAWLCGIARNRLRQRLERDRRLEPLAHDEEPPAWAAGPEALADLLRVEQVEAVRKAVLSLPLRYREVVVLCDLQELPYADAAEALSCAVGTVRSRLHRGRALLASKLSTAAREAGSGGLEGRPSPARRAGPEFEPGGVLS